MVHKYNILQTKLSFGEAFDKLKTPGKLGATLAIRLPIWKDDVCIRIQYPDKNSKMTAPYLYVDSRYGKVPWKETMIELFSNEWVLINILEESDVSEKDNQKEEYPNEKCSDRCKKRCLNECNNAKCDCNKKEI
jgi:hypothetical protein